MVLMSFVNSPIVPSSSDFWNTKSAALPESRLFRRVRLLMGPNERAASAFQKTHMACAGTMRPASGSKIVSTYDMREPDRAHDSYA